MTHYGRDNKYKGRETKMQVSCYNMLHYRAKHPLVWHTANERKTSMRAGARLKAQGVRAGIPDLLCAEARGHYHGLAVELKVQGGTVSASQKTILELFKQKGWFVAVVWSIDGMDQMIKDYWALPGEDAEIGELVWE